MNTLTCRNGRSEKTKARQEQTCPTLAQGVLSSCSAPAPAGRNIGCNGSIQNRARQKSAYRPPRVSATSRKLFATIMEFAEKHSSNTQKVEQIVQLASLFVHPLKSARGIAYDRAFASWQGLLHDREWLLVDAAGQFITARDYPKLVNIHCTPIPGALLFQAPDFPTVAALVTQFDTPIATTVWKDHFTAYHGSPMVDAWFSRYLGLPCRLLWLGLRPLRKQKTSDQALSFADAYPYLLVNQSSLDELNSQLPQPVTERHFRPNLVIDGAQAYEEDDWKVIRIGSIVFDVTKPCTRCQLTTVDPDSGIPSADGEPLATLIRTRQLAEGICFGINLAPRNEGILQAGDPLEVLELRYTF